MEISTLQMPTPMWMSPTDNYFRTLEKKIDIIHPEEY